MRACERALAVGSWLVIQRGVFFLAPPPRVRRAAGTIPLLSFLTPFLCFSHPRPPFHTCARSLLVPTAGRQAACPSSASAAALHGPRTVTPNTDMSTRSGVAALVVVEEEEEEVRFFGYFSPPTDMSIPNGEVPGGAL